MKKIATALLLTSAFGLSACANMTSDQRYATGALAGGAAGLAAGERLGGNSTEKAAATLAGAAIGGAVASNSGPAPTRSCVYPNGQPAPCPVGY
ncbi:glycine zipper 2TM domain-containing protein [Litorisediminicola beolgyonensis]|uniref:17 kDa surface antigen n=1 Tax=Litorisediminicola beolgyonensis TaxID=1173614 RepID=A0ABW3ZFV0_9RHOB